jgi:hypothetical protein
VSGVLALDSRDAELLDQLAADPFLARFALEAEIEEAFAVATAVDDDAVTQPVLLAPTRVRVGTDLSWTLLDAEAYS